MEIQGPGSSVDYVSDAIRVRDQVLGKMGNEPRHPETGLNGLSK
jgi:hypothetical protein